MVLGITPVAIIDHQLPFEYTITSRSTDVMVMAQPVQNIDHSAFRSMFEREQLFGNNFSDWFRQLKLVLRVEKKMFVIEQPLSATLATDSAANFKNSSPYDMIKELKSMFEKQAEVERPTRTSWLCATIDLTISLILNGPTKDFAGFVRNYNMHNMGKTIGELHAMLIEYEKGLPKNAETPQVMMIKGGKIQKFKKKSLKAKGKGKANGKENDKQAGHWKWNCLVYIAELLKKKKQVGFASSSGIFIIELFAFPNKSWVYDTGCGTHICITKHEFREARKLKHGALYLYMGNDVRAQVESIGSFDLVLPNGLVICLDNCHYAPCITRGVVSVQRLVENGFVQCFTDFGISVSKNNVFYFNAIPSNGIYEIDMHDLVPNEGILRSIDDESFDQCVSCLSGKMARKSFPHRPERATGLLGIIHTDVFKNEVENQLGQKIKALRSDRGGEYISQEFKDYLKACGIVQQLTPPYTPQHNGVSKRRNRTLLDMADKTPYESWYGKILNLSYLKDTQKKQWVTIFTSHLNKIVVTRYAEFFEKNLITQEVSGRAVDLEEIQDEDTSPSEITSEIPMEVEGFKPPQEKVIPIRRSERTHRAPNRLCLNVEVDEHSLGDLNETASYKAAMLDLESNKWIHAMNAKIHSMTDNMVWFLVGLFLGCKTVGRVDYEETFSPVADIRAIRILISIVAFYDYEIWQMDVKTAFLNGYLDEYIYMVKPEGSVDPNYPRKVCRLQRSIYGLKQASRSWNKRFDEEIKRFGFTQILDEPCVYQKYSRSNVTFLILYVDDIIIMRNHIPSLQSVKDYLGKCFAMKDLGKTTFILEIKIYRDMSKRLIGLGQNAYMDKILKRYKIDNSKRGHIPMQERLDLKKTEGASTPKEVKLDWKSSKQSTTAMSATEAEYIAASEAAMEAVWIRKFILGLGIVQTINEPIRMFYDNSAALHFANDPRDQRGARHYHRRYHYARESIALGEIRFLKVHTDDNLADPFTKALSNTKLTQHARSMGLRLASSFIIMNPQETQQVAAHDEKWVPSAERVKINSTNIKLETTVPQKEETFQVQFWYTIKKVQDTDSYEFLLANKKCTVNAEVFRIILDICQRVEGVDFTDVLDDDTAFTFLIDLGYKESYQMFIKYSTNQIPPKKSRGKGSKGKKTVDESHEIVDVSEQSKHGPEPAKKKTFSKRRVKKKVTLSADDNIISDDPDVALELAKIVTESIPKSAKKKSGGRSSKSVVIQDTLSNPKSKPATSKTKLKCAPLLLHKKKKLQTLCKLLRKVKKTSRRHPSTGGSNKGTGDEQDSEHSDDNNSDVKKDDKDGDADDEGDDHVKMKDAEVEESDKGEDKVTDATKEEAEKTLEAKDDTKKTELPPSSSSLSVSSSFGDQFLKLSFDSSLVSTVKDSADTYVSSLLDIPSQRETPQIQVAKLEKDVSELKTVDHSSEALALLQSQVPMVVDSYLDTKVGDVFQKEMQKHTAYLIHKYSLQHLPELTKKPTPTTYKTHPQLLTIYDFFI
uniref:Integrase catalytic domain-containing protein n=1 Tax=Tanacetum cinerariifolium TaxID=118510 RepID=A0A6L2JVA6_TANCI|nr:hypothetical protein [Tanacetum cinerariifolium]